MAEHKTEAADQEPTMEEILASIRRIISEDGEEGDASPEANAEAEGEGVGSGDEDVLDLGLAAEPAPEPAPEIAPEPALEPELEMDAEPAAADSVDDDDMELEVDAEADLTEALSEELEALKDAPQPSMSPDDLDFVDGHGDDEAPAAAEPVAAAPSNAALDQERLVSPPVADATAGAFGALLNNILVSSNNAQGLTLDDIVRELLKPMLKEWLDNNLEEIVKARVAEEIDRISARVRR